MKYLIALASLTLILTACGEETISFKVHPARPPPNAQAQPPEGWQLVEFSGSPRTKAGAYFLRQEHLFTEFSVIDFRDAGDQTIAVRLNAYSLRQLQQFADDPANLKQPLAININGRCADIFPFLQAPKDRMFLYGFSKEEKNQLRRSIETR